MDREAFGLNNAPVLQGLKESRVSRDQRGELTSCQEQAAWELWVALPAFWGDCGFQSLLVGGGGGREVSKKSRHRENEWIQFLRDQARREM